MTDNTNTPDVTPDDNLDDFAAEFFGQNDAAPDTTKSESPPEGEDGGDDALTNGNEVEDADEDNDTLDTEDNPEEDLEEGDGEDESSEDADSDANTKAKAPKKGRFQERIDELTSARRDAERREAEALDRIRKLEEKLGQNETSKSNKTEEAVTTAVGPNPSDKDENGEDKYPLGEFDPQFIKDLVQHTLDSERSAQENMRAEQVKNQELEQARAQTQEAWEAKLEPARERYPDFQDKGQALIDSLAGIDQSYGEYLTDTIMSMDNGPDVLYYLATNPDEAHAIVNSGARAATVALGRIEAQFSSKDNQPKKAIRPSNAPTPPPTTKGSSVAKARVAPDTDDLDSFEKEFFKKK